MPSPKPVHPIRRVRDALKASPEELGLREYATSAGFAKLLGRSSSLIRNVECGVTKNWVNVADLIQRKTRVSREWLLGEPKPEDPILDVSGRPWNPGRELDPLRPRRDMPDWRKLLETCPGTIPDLMAETVKAQLTLELSIGRTEFLEALVSLIARSSSFENPALEQLNYRAHELIEKGTSRKVWRTSRLRDEFDSTMAQLQEAGTESLTLDQMNEILQAGDFGWATKLTEPASQGIIKMAKKFYQPRASRDYSRTEDGDDAEQE